MEKQGPMSNQPPEWKKVLPYQKLDDARRPNKVNGTRVPKLPFENWLDESGNLIRLAMASTRNFEGAIEAGGDPNRSISFNRARALREGKVPWGFSNASRHAPWLVGTKTEAEWNVWREEELQRRRTAYEDKALQNERAWKTDQAKQANAMVDAVVAAMGRIAQPAAVAPKDERKK